MFSLGVFVFAAAEPESGLESTALAPLIKRANAYLSVGQFGDAARTYTEAIEQSPTDYTLYYKRATAYYSSNRHSNALDDFETVLRLTNGQFDSAIFMKAKILAGEGEWAEAKKLTKKYTKKKGTTEKDVQDLLFSITEGEVASKKAQKAHKDKKYEECIEQATHALTTASHSIPIRELRVDCAMAHGDLEQAIGDLTRLTHLTKPSASRFLRIANLSYYLLPPDNTQAIQTLKQCLHFDPDSKPCRTAHRTLKALEKEFTKLDNFEKNSSWASLVRFVAGTSDALGFAKRFDESLDAATGSESHLDLPASIIPRKTSPRRLRIYALMCKAHVKSNQLVKGEEWCEETLKIDPRNIDGLVGRGERALKNEEWDEAVRAFDAAFEASGKSSQEINQLLQKAQRLLKQSKKKDYYKVLDVSRDADQKTIKKAYRKATMKAHPDKGGSEAKMATVNEAYEVLSSPELRARFDNGDDPNDPEAGRGPGGGGFPFGGGGHPFQQMFFQQGGGGGQQFRSGGHGGGQQFQFQWG